MEIETSNLVGRLSVAILLARGWQGIPERGVVKSREPRFRPVNHLNFGGHNHIPGTADRLRRCQLSSPVSVINF